MTENTKANADKPCEPAWNGIAKREIVNADQIPEPCRSRPAGQIAAAILSGETELMETPIRLFEDSGARLEELIQLLLALEANGQYTEGEEALLMLISNAQLELAEEVSAESGDYPNQPIKADVWLAGSAIRNWCGVLSDYCERNGIPGGRFEASFAKAKITCTIMSHYPWLVGPDMITLGMSLEAIGEPEKAEGYYRAVLGDFSKYLDGIKENPDDRLDPNQVICLTTLKQAYSRLSVIRGYRMYEEDIAIIRAAEDRFAQQEEADEADDEA